MEVIHLAGDRGLGQDAGGLLEGGRRDEALGRQRGLGDAEQQRGRGRGLAAGLGHPIILALEEVARYLLLEQEVGVARVDDLHEAHHLADDDLDVLVVDGHAL